MAAKKGKKYPDLRYKFIRGLLKHEGWQRERHFMKGASEWTSKGIVSLELAEDPVKSVAQAGKFEGIGTEMMKKLREYEASLLLSGAAPRHGYFLSSAPAILVCMARHAELNKEEDGSMGRMRRQQIREWAQPLCEERFLEETDDSKLETTKLISGGDSSVRGDGGGRGCEVRADATYIIPEHKACKNCWHSKAICPAMWRLEVLTGRGYVKKRTLQKMPIYELQELGVRTAAKLRGQPIPEPAPDAPVPVLPPALPSLIEDPYVQPVPAPTKRGQQRKKSSTNSAENNASPARPLPMEIDFNMNELLRAEERSKDKEKHDALGKKGGTLRRTQINTEPVDPFGALLGVDGDAPEPRVPAENFVPNAHRSTLEAAVNRKPPIERERVDANPSRQNYGRSKTTYQRRTFLGEPHLNSIVVAPTIEKQDKWNKRTQGEKRKETPAKRERAKRKETPTKREKRKREEKEKEKEGEVDPQLLHLYTNDTGKDGLILVIDVRELGGDRTSLDQLIDRVKSHGMTYRTESLPVGDYVWVLRCGGQETTLPLMIERKRADDLARSLKDGRYYKQKACMLEWKEDLKKKDIEGTLKYIIEERPEQYVVKCADRCGAVVKCGFPTLTQLKVVLSELERDESFDVLHTDNLAATVDLLMLITDELQTRVSRGEFDELAVKEFMYQQQQEHEQTQQQHHQQLPNQQQQHQQLPTQQQHHQQLPNQPQQHHPEQQQQHHQGQNHDQLELYDLELRQQHQLQQHQEPQQKTTSILSTEEVIEIVDSQKEDIMDSPEIPAEDIMDHNLQNLPKNCDQNRNEIKDDPVILIEDSERLEEEQELVETDENDTKADESVDQSESQELLHVALVQHQASNSRSMVQRAIIRHETRHISKEMEEKELISERLNVQHGEIPIARAYYSPLKETASNISKFENASPAKLGQSSGVKISTPKKEVAKVGLFKNSPGKGSSLVSSTPTNVEDKYCTKSSDTETGFGLKIETYKSPLKLNQNLQYKFDQSSPLKLDQSIPLKWGQSSCEDFQRSNLSFKDTALEKYNVGKSSRNSSVPTIDEDVSPPSSPLIPVTAKSSAVYSDKPHSISIDSSLTASSLEESLLSEEKPLKKRKKSEDVVDRTKTSVDYLVKATTSQSSAEGDMFTSIRSSLAGRFKGKSAPRLSNPELDDVFFSPAKSSGVSRKVLKINNKDLDSDSDSDSLPDIGLSPPFKPKPFSSNSYRPQPERPSTSRNPIPVLSKDNRSEPVLSKKDRSEPDFTAGSEQTLAILYKDKLAEVKCFAPHVSDKTILEFLSTYNGNVEATVTAIFEDASQNME